MRPEATVRGELNSRDRREVRSAVRHGRAVDEAALAPAAITLAREVQEQAQTWTLRTPEGWPSLIGGWFRGEGWIALLGLLLLAIWITDPVTVAFEIIGVLLVGRWIVRYARNAPVLAAQAEAANRALLGEPGGPFGEVAEPLPWWKPRQGLPRGKPEVSGWLPIPLSRLVPFWLGSVVVIVLVGLTLPAWVQWLLPFVYFTLWIEVERRLGERVEAQLGPEETRRARGCDIAHSPRRKWAALYVLVLVGQFFLVGAIYRSGWFNGHGIGVIFTLGLLLYVVERDLASRWRWRRLQTHVH